MTTGIIAKTYDTTTVFCQINTPGVEAENESLSLSDFNEINSVNSFKYLIIKY